MLPILLVLFVASSTLAAPGALLNAISINDAVPPKHNGKIVSAYWTDRASEVADGGDTPPYILTAQQVLNDLSNQSDKSSQALGIAQAIAVLGSLGTGIPGDACAAAEVIDAYVWALRTGNKVNIRSAVSKFIQSVFLSIDLIVELSTNPSALRFATGPRGNCRGGGRTYQFEAAWDSILSNASPSSAGLVHEQYCAAKRLYNAFSSRSNNAGAFITASSLPPVNRVFQEALVPVARFLAAVHTRSVASAAVAAKKALAHASKN